MPALAHGFRVGRSPWLRLLAGLLAIGTLPDAAAGQEPRVSTEATRDSVVEATVLQIAGTSVYLDAGSDAGWAEGDTLVVHEEAPGETWIPGRLLIVAVGAERAAVTWAEETFPLTRGQILRLSRRAGELRAPAGPADAAPGLSPREGPRRLDPAVREATRGTSRPEGRTRGPTSTGRAVLDISALQSTTHWGDGPDGEAVRTFATPSLRVDARVSDLPGGFQLSTYGRVAYRSSPPSLVQPATSIRLYEVSLERRFEGRLPVELRLGRFRNPRESFGGYFDGALVRLGGMDLGVGAALGFQPDRWNEGFSSDLPKASLFGDYDRRTDWGRVVGDVSFHHVRPGTDLAEHSFGGWSQDVWVGRTRIWHDLQIDRDPHTGGFVVGRLDLSASAPLSGGVRMFGRYSRRRPWSLYALEDPFLPLRERVGAGLSFDGRDVSVSFDAGATLSGAGGRGLHGSGSFRIGDTGGSGVGVLGSATLWRQEDQSVVMASLGVERSFSGVRTGATYRFSDSRWATTVLRTHAANVAVRFRLSPRVGAVLQARSQFGRSLTSHRLNASLSWRW